MDKLDDNEMELISKALDPVFTGPLRHLTVSECRRGLIAHLLAAEVRDHVEHRKGLVFNHRMLNYDTGDDFRCGGEVVTVSSAGKVTLTGDACNPGVGNIYAAILCLFAAGQVSEEEGVTK